MSYSARDVARALLADGVQPGAPVDDWRDYDRAFSRADPEGRLAGMVVRAARRELGTEIADRDAKLLDYRQADFLMGLLRREHNIQRSAVYEKTPEPEVTIAHLMSGTQYDLSHVVRHAEALKTAKPGEVAFHQDHIEKHAKSAADHADRLALALRHKYPVIGSELDGLLAASNLENS